MSEVQSFGQRLRQRRKALDMTQEDLAGCVGCSQTAIRMIEHGQRRPSRQVAELLARCLRIPEEEQAPFVALARQTLPAQPAPGATEPQDGAGPARQTEPGNLPARLTALIGRAGDVETLRKLLLRKDVRLVTLTGAPGVGKTSLAIEAAADLQDHPDFPDGVFWVALAAITDPDLVIPSIARMLAVEDTGSGPLAATLKRHLRQSRMLMLLDNFEQVVEAAPAIADLLESCANLKVLVTSREALDVHGEREFSVHTLPLPDRRALAAQGGMGLETLAANPAVALFVERAQSVDRNFVLSEENALDVAAICERLDGLPLAIELVAARTRILPIANLLQRLQGEHEQARLNLLSGGARTQSARHRTLRDAIGWSYDLLTPTEQLLFRRLGVFLGGFTLPAAEAVCNAASDFQPDLFEHVSQLLHKNLLKREHTPGGTREGNGEPRFSMPEMVREYSLERLGETGEKEELRLLHAEYFLAMASSFDLVMVGENEKVLGLRIDSDYDNVRAALAWTLENRAVDMALPFGLSLSRYWEIRGHYSEGRDWLQRIISAQSISAEKDPDAACKLAWLRLRAGRLSLYMTDYATARSLLEDSLAVATEQGIESLIGSASGSLGILAWLQGDHAAAEPLYEVCLKIHEQSKNMSAVANTTWALGTIAAERGNFERAENLLKHSISMAKEIGDTYVASGSLRDLGVTLCYKGEYREASGYIEQGIALAREAQFRVGVNWAMSALGFARLGQGDYTRAEELFRESLRLAKTIDKHKIPDSLEGLAEVEFVLAEGGKAQARLQRAATLLGAAEAIRGAMKSKIIPVRAPSRGRLVAEVRSRLGPETYEQAYRLGEAMSFEEVLSLA